MIKPGGLTAAEWNTMHGHVDAGLAILQQSNITDRDVIAMVEYLTQAIGVFPTGTLVELNTGEVGVVTAQNPERRLRPKVNLILNEAKQPRGQPIIADLNAMDTDVCKPPKVWIKRELPPGAFGIHAAHYFT